jgi:hypothetical protein
MTQHQLDEIQVAFVIWELLSQLEALLWDRYFEEFNAILYEREKKRGMEIDFPFHPKKDF